MSSTQYTTELQKTTGALDELREVFHRWEPGMERGTLTQLVIDSGALGRSSITRAKDIVTRTFAQRFLLPDDRPARRIKTALNAGIDHAAFRDLVFLYTLRAHPIIRDFLTERYWPATFSGHREILGSEIVAFLEDVAGTHRMPEPWSTSVMQRVARNLGKTLTDFGFFEDRRSPIRRIRYWNPSSFLFAYTLIEGHEDGVSDTALLDLSEWGVMGMNRRDVVDRCSRVSGTSGPFQFQYAGDIARFSWRYQTTEEYLNGSA
ncbi:MAG: BrxA family protein [Alkalispirochaeta sp.]